MGEGHAQERDGAKQTKQEVKLEPFARGVQKGALGVGLEPGSCLSCGAFVSNHIATPRSD